MATQSPYAAGLRQCFLVSRDLLCYILHYCEKTSWGIMETSSGSLQKHASNRITIGCVALINPLQQELHTLRGHAWAVPPRSHQGAPSARFSVSRRPRRPPERGSPAPCASGGRSGRGGVRSAGSSGDPPRRSAPWRRPDGRRGRTAVRLT